jgi:hypothetical protein
MPKETVKSWLPKVSVVVTWGEQNHNVPQIGIEFNNKFTFVGDDVVFNSLWADLNEDMITELQKALRRAKRSLK